MLDGFKKFILRGNVVDMAVGVVIGAAFGGVVGSLTKGLLTPFIGALIKLPDFSNLKYEASRQHFSRRRFPQRCHLILADRGRRVFLCRCSH